MSHSILPLKTNFRPVDDRRRLPGSMELASLFKNFIRYWAGLNGRYHGEIPEELSPMPVEICVRWNGPIQGTLVLRCFKDFPKWIQKNFDASWAQLVEKELLGEMSSLFCVHLMNSYWSRDFFELGPLIARPSQPSDWPQRIPDSTCNISVDQQWVELRLWVDYVQDQKSLSRGA